MVECYSGREYAEQPRRFFWEGAWRTVTQILAERRLPEGKQFVVAEEEGNSFVLTYEIDGDHWTIRPSEG
jgi:hypothetical protein